MITVVVVDDAALLRAGIVRLIESAGDLRVIGEGGDGREAIRLVRRDPPDVLLIDLQMPVMDGLDALLVIRREHPEVAVVVLTGFLSDEYVVPALRGGAVGYVLKDAAPAELHSAVRAAAAGGSVLSAPVAARLIAAAGTGVPERRARALERLAALTPQEREVVAALAGGLTNAEIAARLFLAESTVKAYLTAALGKLGLANRTQAAILAHEAGLGEAAADETETGRAGLDEAAG